MSQLNLSSELDWLVDQQSNVTESVEMNLNDSCQEYLEFFEANTDAFSSRPKTLKFFLVGLYSVISVVGAIGNGLVIAAVLRNAQLRTTRNLLIVNLAVSDFLMCTVTVPLTLKFVLERFWAWGAVLCKLVASMLGANIFMSNLSVISIGLDRFLVILFPTNHRLQNCAALMVFGALWLLSFTLASPMFFSNDAVDMVPGLLDQCGFTVFLCGEDNHSPLMGTNFKLAYTTALFLAVYFLPLVSLIFLYGRVLLQVGRRLELRAARTFDAQRRKATDSRQAKLNRLIISIVAIYAGCWLPLSTFNILVAYDTELYSIEVFAVCHMLGMMSACGNPVVYGLFNDNFRAEFELICKQLGLGCLITNCRRLRSSSLQPANTGLPQVPTCEGLETIGETQRDLTAAGETLPLTSGYSLSPNMAVETDMLAS